MEIQQAAFVFCLEGKPVSCQRFGNGHINRTFIVQTDCGKKYVLQQINHHVFRDPVALMENAVGVTRYILDRGHTALRFLPDTAGAYCHRDAGGNFWRCYEFVEGVCLEAPRNAEEFRQSGIGFGRFQELLSGYDAATLHETIPNFHNTPDRFRQLKLAIEENRAGRLDSARDEVEFYLAHEEPACRLYKLFEAGRLPLRVTHNDTKLNNVLLTQEMMPLCVLDLDTVMPGLSACDFGDSIRFGAATAAEDERDPGKMKLDMALFRAYADGFLTAAPSLTDEEVRALPLGAIAMTLECGSRFLKDYLDGDIYFRTAYPEHNLVRCRTQMALAADMLNHLEEMESAVLALR